MKKIHSIGYAHKIIGIAVLFLTVIPFCFYILKFIFRSIVFSVFMYIFLAVGFLILLFFIGLFSIELHQDKKINRQYIHIKKTKIDIGNELYECQSCGNRQVKDIDKYCNICGIKFKVV